jgi:hypothetical protein
MEYYIMEMDKRIQNKFVIQKFPGNGMMEYDTSYATKFKDHTGLLTVESDKSSYPEVLETPLYMVSETIRRVLELHDDHIVCKEVTMANLPKQTIKHYAVLLTDRIECLHDSTELYPDGSVKKLVLDRSKIGDRRVFRVKGISAPYIIVSLDIAESVLRRNCFGVKFSHVDCA